MKKAILPLLTLLLYTANARANVYQEHEGIVVMEAENSDSNLDLWVERTDIPGYIGNGYIEFTGNKPAFGSAKSPQVFKFKIHKEGLYFLHMRCAREKLRVNQSGELDPNADWRGDVANDCWVRLAGDFEAGPHAGDSQGDDAPKSMLLANTKYYGGADKEFEWVFGNRFDAGGHGNKRRAVYQFKAGETYTMTISGRSQFFKLDRIMLRHKSVRSDVAENLLNPESGRWDGTGTAPEPPIQPGPPVKRYKAIDKKDFDDTIFPIAGEVPYAKEWGRKALAVDASVEGYQDKFARAVMTFDGQTLLYRPILTTVQEEVGEGIYKLWIDGVLHGTVTNDPTDTNYTEQEHLFPPLTIAEDTEIWVESKATSNETIPEGDGVAYALGLFKTLTFEPLEAENGFDTFAARFELIGGPLDDDDGDGLSNFYEYGVGGDPTNRSSLGGTPKVIHGESGEVLFSTVQLIDRANLPIRYTVLHCTDLESGDWTPFAEDGTIINDLPGSDEYEEVQYRLSISGDESHEIFLRLSVEETQ